MKSKLEIFITPDNKIALVDSCASIKKGCKVIHIRNFSIQKALSLDNKTVDGKNSDHYSLGYIGHGGASFLWFRPEVHRRFIKYITKKDLEKLI